MSNHFNELTPAELERLAILVEETGEALQAVGKILRHGFEFSRFNNKADLERELGDVRHAMIRLCEAGDLSKKVIHDRADEKRESIKPWLHHQDEQP